MDRSPALLHHINDDIWPAFRIAGDLADCQQDDWQILQDGMGDAVELFRVEEDGSITGPFKCPKNGYSQLSLPEIPQQIIVIDFTTRRLRISVPPGILSPVIDLLVESAVIKLIKKEKPYKWHIE